MNDVLWGSAPTQRQRKSEKYSMPVLTMTSLDKPGAGRKFTFNKSAQEELNLTEKDQIVFGYSTVDNRVFFKKLADPKAITLTKTFTFSDKKTFDTITKRFGLTNDVENEFDIVLAQNCFEIVLKSNDETIETPVETIEEDVDTEEVIEELEVTDESQLPKEENTETPIFSSTEEVEEEWN